MKKEKNIALLLIAACAIWLFINGQWMLNPPFRPFMPPQYPNPLGYGYWAASVVLITFALPLAEWMVKIARNISGFISGVILLIGMYIHAEMHKLGFPHPEEITGVIAFLAFSWKVIIAAIKAATRKKRNSVP